MYLRAALRLFVLSAALLGLGLLPARAATADRPFDIEAMLRVAMIDDLRLSADGSKVAFTVTQADLGRGGNEMRSSIYLGSTAKGLSKVVSSRRYQCEKPRFSPDGSKLAYLVDSDSTTDVVVRQLATGHVRRLTHGHFDVVDLAFSPDGSCLALTIAADARTGETRRGTSSEVEIVDESDGYSGLYLLSLKPGARLRPVVTNRDVGVFAFAPDGRHIVFETTEPDTPLRGRRGVSPTGKPAPVDASHADIAVVDIRTRNMAFLASSPASENTPCYSPDGCFVAYVATTAPGFYYNEARVMVVPAAGGAPRALALTPDERPELVGWASDGKHIYVREPKGTGAVLLAVPVDGSTPLEISNTPHLISGACLASSGKQFGLVLTDCDMPPEVFVTPADRFEPRPVSDVNAPFAAFRVGKTEIVRWKSSDGTVIEGLYTHPVTPTDKAPPLLVELHGGPALVADRQYLGAVNYYPLAVFAERGYALLQPNVRGSDGYGTAFRMATRGDWGGLDFADLQSGIDALVAKGLADPQRLGIMGWSYGGYLAAWAIGHTTRFKAASIGAGITDLVSQCGSMDLPDFIPLYFGGEVYEKFRLLFDHSPLKYAASIKTPTLLQHGVADERVPFSQSLELYTALSRLGVTTRLAAYPRSGHDVTEPGLIRDLMQRNLDWFLRYVGPAGSPGGTVADQDQPGNADLDRPGTGS